MAKSSSWSIAFVASSLLAWGLIAQEGTGDTAPAKYATPKNATDWQGATAALTEFRAARRGGPEPGIGGLDYQQSGSSRRKSEGGAPSAETTRLARLLDSPGTDCWYSTMPTDHDSEGDLGEAVNSPSFSHLVSQAKAVVEGRVTGLEGGFYMKGHGGPGLLVQVEVTRWYKRVDDYPEVEVVHYFHPAGEFRLGEARLCRSSEGWPAPPEVGARILILPQVMPHDARIARIQGLGGEIAFEAQGVLRATDSLTRFPEFRVLKYRELRRALLEALGDGDQR